MTLHRGKSEIPPRVQVISQVIRNKGSLLTMTGVIMTRGSWSEFRGRQALAQPKENTFYPSTLSDRGIELEKATCSLSLGMFEKERSQVGQRYYHVLWFYGL